MGTVNQINVNVDQTVRIFDQFYRYEVVVPVNEYDVVNSFFVSIYKDKEAARNFTTSLFYISQQTNVPALTLLNQIQGQNSVELTLTMTYFLNGIRSPSTLLGINSAITPNLFTARNILA